jgi:Zn-finger protein
MIIISNNLFFFGFPLFYLLYCNFMPSHKISGEGMLCLCSLYFYLTLFALIVLTRKTRSSLFVIECPLKGLIF